MGAHTGDKGNKDVGPPKSQIENEYPALRDEVLKRVELQFQLINLALIIAGSLLTVSLGGNYSKAGGQNEGPAVLLLVCPVLELFLALAWAAHNVQIGKVGTYIRDTFEPEWEGGWENYWPSNRGIKGAQRQAVRYLFTGGCPAIGVFVGTQALALIAAYLKSDTGVFTSPVFYAELAVVGLTVFSIYTSDVRRKDRKGR